MLAGLFIETMPNGSTRLRVRQKGNRNRKFSLGVEKDHPDFKRRYELARLGYDPKGSKKVALLISKVGIEPSFRKLLSGAKSRSRDTGHHFGLTMNFLIGLLERQEFRCALSKMLFDFEPPKTGYRKPNSISIDRIDCRFGYVPDNIRLVTVMVNVGRSDWTDEDFVEMCRMVSKASECPTKNTGSPTPPVRAL